MDLPIDPNVLVSQFFDTVEVHTSATPPLIFPISAGGAPPSPLMAAALNSLQPTVVLSGPAGRVVVAPYGETKGATSWLPLALVSGALVLGLGWAFFGGRKR